MTFYAFMVFILAMGHSVLPVLSERMLPVLDWHTRQTEEGEKIELTLRKPDVSLDRLQIPKKILNDSIGVALTAHAALAVDDATGAVLYGKNADEKRPIASITKIMSLLVVLDSVSDLDAPIEITADDYVNLGYNSIPVGEIFRTRDLIAIALIESNNTVMRALTRATGLSRDAFVVQMNAKARELNLADTIFADETGLSEKNVSTAADVIRLARHAFQKPLIAGFADRASYTARATSGAEFLIRSTNNLLGGMIHIVAGKTGYVSESGYNLVASAEDKKHLVYAVVLGSATNDDRFQDYKMLMYWIWNNFEWPQENI